MVFVKDLYNLPNRKEMHYERIVCSKMQVRIGGFYFNHFLCVTD